MDINYIPLKPFEYQIKLKDYLQKNEKIWKWFADDKAKKEHFEKFKKEILKDSYRIDDKTHPEIFDILKEIKEKINLPIDITIYQEQMSYQNNVGIIFYQDEAQIVISGRVIKLLNTEELKAILAHELYHYYLFYIDQKAFEITDRIITSIANDADSPEVYLESARLFKLYTELYCDRGAYEILENKDAMISALVKLSTGIDRVNVEAYLEQADEILENDNKSTHAVSHPETFIRAKALDLWVNNKEEAAKEIEKYIEPKIEFEKLNLFSQEKLQNLTYQLISIFLKPVWSKSERIVNMAKEYFPNFIADTSLDVEDVFEQIAETGNSTKKYLSYVLLDFALVDSELGNIPLGYAFELADYTKIIDEFNVIVKKELNLTVRKLKELQKEAITELNQTNESKQDSLYEE
jgi:hypothetical protein